jgi:hypothetical protein
MILKLTYTSGNKFLIDTTNLVFTPNPVSEGTKLFPLQQDTNYQIVKETIEEITQQIKEGGITNGTN